MKEIETSFVKFLVMLCCAMSWIDAVGRKSYRSAYTSRHMTGDVCLNMNDFR
jgi:hypothetical protein